MTIFKRTNIIVIASWIVVYLIYYNNNFILSYTYAHAPYIQSSKNEIRFYNHTYKGSEKYLINTPGCYIPNYSRTLKIKEIDYMNRSCGVRAVIVNKVPNDEIEFKIDKEKMNIYSKGKTYRCCVRFVSSLNVSEKIDLSKLEYTICTPFHNGSKIKLEQEIISVTCYSKMTAIYEDVYMVLKKIFSKKDKRKIDVNAWNILILGMDTMSRARLISSMPRTAQYLREHNWIDFRGYQKVGYNTFPNVMALLTGKNVSTIYQACSHGLDTCSNLLLWNQFKKNDYITAYGEDFLRLPDTFSKFNGFTVSPTDHYMRPLFLTGESDKGNYVCTKKLSSALHLLDYAYQFSDAYKKYKRFGMFWINSCSHNSNNLPTLYDEDFVTFFKKMYDGGIMENTFILFVSDHGLRYGSMRVPMESYYEERLPMCWVWVPTKFREKFTNKYTNLLLNQERLITPYDIYLTMQDILNVNRGSNEVITSEACPLCKSLFREVSHYRKCADVGVDDKWCSCHNMTAVDKNKKDVLRSLEVATAYLEKSRIGAKTKPCTECVKFNLKTVLRSHSYEVPEQNKVYYVVAFVMDPGDVSYEAIVIKYKNEFSVVGKMETITPYNPRGSCVVNPNDRGYCVCKKIAKCK